MNSEILINKLMAYFNVFSMHELATKLEISQQAISKWKKNNSIMAIKKRCRELGIYNEIFIDFDKEDFGINFPNDIKKTLNIIKTMIKDNQELKNQFHQYLKDFIKDNL